jgi:hypothetical protein
MSEFVVSVSCQFRYKIKAKNRKEAMIKANEKVIPQVEDIITFDNFEVVDATKVGDVNAKV